MVTRSEKRLTKATTRALGNMGGGAGHGPPPSSDLSRISSRRPRISSSIRGDMVRQLLRRILLFAAAVI